MRKNYHFKSPVTKEILDNGTEIWRNNLKKNLCAFTPNHISMTVKIAFGFMGTPLLKHIAAGLKQPVKSENFIKEIFVILYLWKIK